MKRPALALFAGLLALSLLPGSALAGVLATDQTQEVNNHSWFGPTVFGQTFTVGTAGSLGGVDLFVEAVSATNVDVKIETLSRTTGFPLVPANVLAAGTIQVDAAKWYHLDLTPFNVLVGSRLAIVFNLSSANIRAYGALGAASYPNGVACELSGGSWGPNSSPSDFAFRTYVGLALPTAPPPATPTPAPTPPPTAKATPAATPAATLPPTATPTSTPASTASEAPVAANATDSPAPGTGSGSGSSDSGGAMLLIGGVILLALALALGVAGFLLGRRGWKAGPPAAGPPAAGPPVAGPLPFNPPPPTPPAR